MPLSPAQKAAAEQVSKNAPISENQRNAIKKYLTEAYAELRYSSDELFIRALLKCCACLSLYGQRDRYYLKVWLSRIINEVESEKEEK
jgi:hypothetical protein